MIINKMAGILWDPFKNRMGLAQVTIMGFDLEALLSSVSGLQDLSGPFTNK